MYTLDQWMVLWECGLARDCGRLWVAPFSSHTPDDLEESSPISGVLFCFLDFQVKAFNYYIGVVQQYL